VPDASASVAAALGTVAGKVLPNRLTPLFSLYSPTAQDYFYTTVPQMAVSAILGHLNNTCDPQANGSCTTPPALVPYSPVGPYVPGYSQFPSFFCSVGPCVIGTNPQAADSDGDGVSDGVEALTFPYCDPLSPGCAGPSLWVSVYGDDGNACSRDTPCRTFSGALAKSSPGGTIKVLNSGDFGQVTINKPVTLDASGVIGGIQAGSGTAITVNAGPNDKVVLRGLTLDGLGTATNGISFTAGGSLYVENCTVNNFGQYGLDFAPASGNGKLFVTDTLLRNNGVGAVGGGAHLVATTGTGFIASFDGLRSESNVFGLKAETLGVVTVRNSLATNNGYSGFSATTPSGSGSVRMLVENSVSTHNGTYGFLSNSLSTVTLSNVISTNNQFGLGSASGGTIVSFGNNKVQGNSVDGAPNQTLTNR